jgi:hypothetical protein
VIASAKGVQMAILADEQCVVAAARDLHRLDVFFLKVLLIIIDVIGSTREQTWAIALPSRAEQLAQILLIAQSVEISDLLGL